MVILHTLKRKITGIKQDSFSKSYYYPIIIPEFISRSDIHCFDFGPKFNLIQVSNSLTGACYWIRLNKYGTTPIKVEWEIFDRINLLIDPSIVGDIQPLISYFISLGFFKGVPIS